MCYREEFTPGRYVSPLPFLSLSDCAETSQAHFSTLREGKMKKDDGKCPSCLKNIMYDMLSFLLALYQEMTSLEINIFLSSLVLASKME